MVYVNPEGGGTKTQHTGSGFDRVNVVHHSWYRADDGRQLQPGQKGTNSGPVCLCNDVLYLFIYFLSKTIYFNGSMQISFI